MTSHLLKEKEPIARWHRNILIAAAVFSVLAITMGGILCVTQSIRSCPDWPGCFGKILPPLEPSPVLEITHRYVAGISGLLILASLIVGFLKERKVLSWLVLPALISSFLVLAVSYFGAMVVLHGIAPGWAAVDVGSALTLTALMVASAVAAVEMRRRGLTSIRFSTSSNFVKLVWFAVGGVFLVLMSAVLVAGPDSITSCLGWPIYNLKVLTVDQRDTGYLAREVFSVIALLYVLYMLIVGWRTQKRNRPILKSIGWVGAGFLIEMIVQVLLIIFGLNVYLKIVYTVTMATTWGLLVVLAMNTSLLDTPAE